MTWSDGKPYVDELTAGVYAYIQPVGGWMVNNCGVVVDGSGAAVLVDSTSLELLKGSELDYVEEMVGASFQVKNPNATSSCGCGNSFSM